MSPDRSHPGPRTEIRRQWLLVGAGGGALSVSGPAGGPSAKRLMGAVRALSDGMSVRAPSPQPRPPNNVNPDAALAGASLHR